MLINSDIEQLAAKYEDKVSGQLFGLDSSTWKTLYKKDNTLSSIPVRWYQELFKQWSNENIPAETVKTIFHFIIKRKLLA